MERERLKLTRNLAGIRDMSQLPDAVFVVDPKREHIAVAEANKLNIPVIAIVDTNCDPELIDHIIPGNDDAIRTIRLFSSRIADAYLDGSGALEKEMAEEQMAKEAAEAVIEEAAAVVEEAVIEEAIVVTEVAVAEAAVAASAEPVAEVAAAEAPAAEAADATDTPLKDGATT